MSDEPRLCGPVERLVAAARQVRHRRGQASQSTCREVCLACALAVQDHQGPVCVCSGKVTVGGEEHWHWWIRHRTTIIDPTAEQFGFPNDVLVIDDPRESEPLYREEFFFCVHSASVLHLAGKE